MENIEKKCMGKYSGAIALTDKIYAKRIGQICKMHIIQFGEIGLSGVSTNIYREIRINNYELCLNN